MGYLGCQLSDVSGLYAQQNSLAVSQILESQGVNARLLGYLEGALRRIQHPDLASLEHTSPQNALQDALAHLTYAHYGQFHGPKSSSKPAAATGDEKPPFRVDIPTVKIAHPTRFIAVFTVNPTACP